MISGCIFDLDGTLLDTLSSIAASFNRTLTKFGYPSHPVADYRHFIGDGQRKCVERTLPRSARTEANIEAMMAAQREDYAESWWDLAVPYDGVEDLLDRLSSLGVKLAVLSNKDHDFALRCVEYFFPDIRFDAIQGYASDVPHKPDPAGALRIAAALDLRAPEIAIVGDTWADIATANACGMMSVGVLWGFRDYDELKSAGAAHIIRYPQELIEVVEAVTNAVTRGEK